MTWPRWIAISEAWAEQPPAHFILAAVHLKRKQKKSSRSEGLPELTGDLGELLGLFG